MNSLAAGAAWWLNIGNSMDRESRLRIHRQQR